jgi:hypothetical protein
MYFFIKVDIGRIEGEKHEEEMCSNCPQTKLRKKQKEQIYGYK